MFFLLFVLCLFPGFVCFAFHLVCSVFLCFLCIVSHVCRCLFYNWFTDPCNQVGTQLQLINITSYHVMFSGENHLVENEIKIYSGIFPKLLVISYYVHGRL